MNPKTDFFFEKGGQWKEAYEKLRIIALDCNLKEELKWGCPCYTIDKKNVVLIHGFKEYCAYLFFKGALLDDPENILIQQTENVQSPRQVRFKSAEEIVELEPVLKDYIRRAISNEKAGLKVELKETKEFPMPEEFQLVINENPDIKAAFESLTPGRQRGYLLYFSQPKQAKTRESRIEKSVPQIMNGKGLND
ncbi:MAG: hypothetical protein GC181_10345 [Bacteroidetes bacterium]|nr:hypothetical protein [Bacteroidota bacterium]